MSQGKQKLKFERNQCKNFKDIRCHRRTTEDERTTGGRRMKGEFRFHELC